MLMQKYGFITADPLQLIYLQYERMLQFYHLPLLTNLSLTRFTEITSANRETSYPLAPDFTFHIDYSESSVVLFEAYQPGCVARIYLFPIMPTETSQLHRMTAENLTNSYIQLIIDDQILQYPLSQLLEGKEYPFLHPISATHKYPASGVGSYMPFCYQSYMKITYLPHQKLPSQLLHTTINCSKYDMRCPVHIYAGISHSSFPVGTKVKSFKDIETSYLKKRSYEILLNEISTALKAPESNGPDKYEKCKLQCKTLCPGCKIEVFSDHSEGVISAINMRVFKMSFKHPVLLENWNNLLITVILDDIGETSPQINKLPLGVLFGITGSLNNFNGASMGHMKKTCDYAFETRTNTDHIFPDKEITGYFYYPMPYWKNVRVFIEGTKQIEESLVCFQFARVKSYYDRTSTGYFFAQKTYYTDDVSGWRSMLSLDNLSGHIVGMFMDVDNLKAVRNVPLNERFAALQADPVLYVDGRKEASMIGTGLEDYFSYAHGFALAENTTYSFVGNYHASPRRKEPLTWHAYRLHIVDPIPFHKSIHFVMEGTNRTNFHNPVQSISNQQYRKLLNAEKMGLSHAVFYYAKPNSDFISIDFIDFGNITSEKLHSFGMGYPSPVSSRGVFNLYKKKFLGQVTTNKTFNVTGRHFLPGDRYSFYLKGTLLYNHFLLRRVYYQPPLSWKQRSKIWINNVFYGFWFIGMGTTSDEFSLREEDLIFSIDFTSFSDKNYNIKIELEIETDWRDIGYNLFAFNRKY